MRTEKKVFGERQPKIQDGGAGRVLVLVNEREEVMNIPASEGSEASVMTQYSYDGMWVKCGSTDERDVFNAVATQAHNEVLEYDKSDAVNAFTLAGKKMWLPKETRVGLVNSISIEKAAKETNTVLWFDGVCYTIPVDTALQMLSALELYALACYNVTQKHLAEIGKITSIEQLVSYDYTLGYPEHLVFSI